MAKTPDRPRFGRFSEDEKAQIVAEIRRRNQEEGWGLIRLCHEFGISKGTFSNWAQQFPLRPRQDRPQMLPVEVVTTTPPPGPGVLISPQGYRVEGLSVADLAHLLRLLA